MGSLEGVEANTGNSGELGHISLGPGFNPVDCYGFPNLICGSVVRDDDGTDGTHADGRYFHCSASLIAI
jgi:hypothetical protein